jgi:hypothetical protein
VALPLSVLNEGIVNLALTVDSGVIRFWSREGVLKPELVVETVGPN